MERLLTCDISLSRLLLNPAPVSKDMIWNQIWTGAFEEGHLVKDQTQQPWSKCPLVAFLDPEVHLRLNSCLLLHPLQGEGAC